MSTTNLDVAVVGAGPAGAATARHLAEAGLRVALLDSARFPRDKVCGDFVGPEAVRRLGQIGVSEMPGFADSARIHRAAVHLDGEALLSRPFPAKPGRPDHGLVVPRMQLDHWILTAATDAGAKLLEGHRVLGFRPTPDGVTVDADSSSGRVALRAQVLVGADGSNSIVGRSIGKDYPWRHQGIVAVRAYYEGVEGDSERADLFFSSEYFPGYCWLFPTGEGSANVGVGVARGAVPPKPTRLKQLLEWLLTHDPALARRLAGAEATSPVRGWPLSIYNPKRRVVDDRVVLVGDAAGLINPLNGEGIQYSLESARWAADSIVACFESGDFSTAALASYAQRLDLEMHPDMAVANLVVKCIENRLLNPLWMEALRMITARADWDDEYAELAGGILAGLVPATRAMDPRFLAKTVEDALALATRQSLDRIGQGPEAWVSDTRSFARATLSRVEEAARSPGSIVGWGLEMATGATDLAFEVARAFVRRMGQR